METFYWIAGIYLGTGIVLCLLFSAYTYYRAVKMNVGVTLSLPNLIAALLFWPLAVVAFIKK